MVTGVEVLGALSACIGILNSIIQISTNAQRDFKLGSSFNTIMNQLPILSETLQICSVYLEPIKQSLSPDVAQGLWNMVTACKENTIKLRAIAQAVVPGADADRYTRYRMAVKRLGKCSKVEELLRSIAEQAQQLTNYYVVKSVRPDLCDTLEEVIQQTRSVLPTLPLEDDAATHVFNAYGGQQINGTGNSSQHIILHNGNGTSYSSDNASYNFART